MHPLLKRVPRIQMIAVFESAARLGSFTDAAKELGITQPAVSRQITSLERTTGLDLFHRTANSVRLSTAGESLLATVQNAFDAIELNLEVSRNAGPTFLLAANPGFAQSWLLPHLDRLQALLGDADLRLRLFDRDAELDDEVYDAAIHLTPIAGSPPGSRVLFEEIVVPVAAPEFADVEGLDAATEPASLLAVMKLHLDGRDRRWVDWAAWFGAYGLSWSRDCARTSYNNYPLVINDAISGRGVALAWRGLVDGLLDAGTLVVVGPEVRHGENAYQLIPGPSTPLDIVDRLADWLGHLTTQRLKS